MAKIRELDNVQKLLIRNQIVCCLMLFIYSYTSIMHMLSPVLHTYTSRYTRMVKHIDLTIQCAKKNDHDVTKSNMKHIFR